MVAAMLFSNLFVLVFALHCHGWWHPPPTLIRPSSKTSMIVSTKRFMLQLPSWSQLEQEVLSSEESEERPNARIVDAGRATSECTIDWEENLDTRTFRLVRERNGWCLYSARIWLALELLEVPYQTILANIQGDTYDGEDAEESEEIQSHPTFNLLDMASLPLVGFHNTTTEYQTGKSEETSLQLLQDINDFVVCNNLTTTKHWLLPPSSSENERSRILKTAQAFSTIVPEGARPSPRAAYFFSNVEGFRLDALSRETFEDFLDNVEALLSLNGVESNGPFMAGTRTPTLADVVWAPLLERYAVHLPCLHKDLHPRSSPRWPLLQSWYNAMDGVPAYACRVQGDAVSWRKVLFVDPWWPRADLWHSRDSVGPKGELFLTDQDCHEQVCLDGVAGLDDLGSKYTNLWKRYAAARPHVSPLGPASEAACILLRNRNAIIQDLQEWVEYEGYDLEDGASGAEVSLEDGLRQVVILLTSLDSKLSATTNAQTNDTEELSPAMVKVLSHVLEYLDHRVCVPRDMGAPSTAAIRRLHKKFSIDW